METAEQHNRRVMQIIREHPNDFIPGGCPDVYCPWVNRLMRRDGYGTSFGCGGSLTCNECSVSCEVITAQQKRYIDNGYAVPVITYDGRVLAVRKFKEYKHRELYSSETQKKIDAGILRAEFLR